MGYIGHTRADLADYTLAGRPAGRVAWREGDRSGELTLVRLGRERVVAVDWSCSVRTVVGTVLPERVPLAAQDATLPEEATATCRGPGRPPGPSRLGHASRAPCLIVAMCAG